MAKVIGPLHSTEARGRVDSLVYHTWRGIRCVRAFVTPEFASPDPREAQKALVAMANTAWKLISTAQRSSWHDYAQAHPRPDWTGVPVRISGYNAFVSCFTVCSRAGGTPAGDPPWTAAPYPLITLASSQIVNEISIAWTAPAQPTAHTYKVQILRSGPWSLGKVPDSHRAAILAIPAIGASPYADALSIDGRYGYWARVVDADTGQLSPALRDQTDFVYNEGAGPGVAGPNNPGTVADRAGIGTIVWTNPANAKAQDDVYALATLTDASPQSRYIYHSNFGFGPAIHDDATIDGILLEIDRHCLPNGVQDNASPKLVNALGAIVGDSKATGIDWPAADTDTYTVYGGAADLWGVAGLTGADVKDSDFGVVLSAIRTIAGTKAARVDHTRMTIYFTNP